LITSDLKLKTQATACYTAKQANENSNKHDTVVKQVLSHKNVNKSEKQKHCKNVFSVRQKAA